MTRPRPSPHRLLLAAAAIALLAAAPKQAKPPEPPPPDEPSAFAQANQQLLDRQMAKACASFTAFQQAWPASPLAREARAKRAHACARANKDVAACIDELHAMADASPDDWARAYAAWAVVIRGERLDAKTGRDRMGPALDLLEKVAKAGPGRETTEAQALFIELATDEVGKASDGKVDGLLERVLAVAAFPDQRDRALFVRARRQLGDPRLSSRAEKELLQVADGKGAWADDALFALANWLDGRSQPARAAELYRRILALDAAKKSEYRATAERRLADLESPSLSLSADAFALPAEKGETELGFRNLAEAKLTLHRLDVLAQDPAKLFEGNGFDPASAARPADRGWTEKLDAKPYVSATRHLSFATPGAGAFVLEAEGGAATARVMVLSTRLASVVKVAPGRVLVWTVDAVTGKPAAGARTALYLAEGDDEPRYSKLAKDCDARGLCQFDLGARRPTALYAWTAKDGAGCAVARGGETYSSPNEKVLLGYLLTDRPLYRPGEKVGVKAFLRSRQRGPSRPVSGAAFSVMAIDPLGRPAGKRTLKSSAFGTASFELELPKDAPLGAWSLSLGPAQEDAEWLFESPEAGFQVEEYKPPEVQVTVEPVGRPRPGDAVKVRVKAAYYSGGPIADAAGRATVSVGSWYHEWRRWEDELSDDEAWEGYGFGYGWEGPAERFLDDELLYPEQATPAPAIAPAAKLPPLPTFPRQLAFKTGPDGTAELELAPADPRLGGDVEYDVRVVVTDASRREAEGAGSVRISQEPLFVDLRADHLLYKPGERIKVQLRAEAGDGSPESPSLDVRLVKLDAKGLAGQVLAKTVQLADGKGTVELDADALGPVSVEARLAGSDPARAPLAATDLWLTNDARPLELPVDGLALVGDSVPVAVGGVARALLVSPTPGGHALLAIEGDTVHWANVVELKGRAKLVEVPLTADMVPNVVLTATRVARLQVEQAQVPLRVRGGAGALEVKVAFAPKVAQPGATPSVEVALGGSPARAEVAVAVFDEALLAIAPGRDDFMEFFGIQPREIQVVTSSTFDEWSFRALPEPEAVQAPQPPPDFAFHLPGMSGSGAGPDRHAMPAAKRSTGLGDIATGGSSGGPSKAAKGASHDTADRDFAPKREQAPAVAPAERLPPVRVRRDFGASALWQAAAPGQVGGGAKVRLRAKLTDALTSWKAVAYAVTDGPGLGVGRATLRTEQPLMVRLEAPRFFTQRDEVVLSAVVTTTWKKAAQVDVAFTVPGLKPLGRAAQRVKVEPGRQARVDARFAVVEAGGRKVRVTARSGETTDAVELELPAVVHGSAKRLAFAGPVGPKASFEVPLPARRNPAGTRLELTVSPTYASVMLDTLPYLAAYPYGCTEQTLSRFVPAAIAARTVRTLGMDSPRVPKDLDAMVKAGLSRLYGFQHSDGGWGWWQADSSHPWMSAYAVWALWLAQGAGQKVEPEVIAKGRGFLANTLGASLPRPEEHAFMTLALASTGDAPKVALDAAHGARAKLSARGRAMVALALVAAKDPRAAAAVEALSEVVPPAGAPPALASFDQIETLSFALLAAARQDPTSALARQLAEALVLRREGTRWRTTRDSALAVFGLAELAAREKAEAAGALVVKVNGKQAGKVAWTKGGLEHSGPVAVGDQAFKAGQNSVEIAVEGKGGGGWWSATWDVYDEDEDSKGLGGDVAVTRRYFILGRPGGEKAVSTMEYGMALESGERVRVELEVAAKKAMEFVVVEDLKPAGLESVAQLSGPAVCGGGCTHAELKPDRVAMFLTWLPAGTRKLSYELRAEVPGKFHGLPARASAMYQPDLRATSDEWRVEVRDSQNPEQGTAKK